MYRMITTIIIIVSYIECSNFDRIVSSSHIVNTKYGMLMGNLVRLSSQLKSTKSEILSNLPDVETYLGIPYATSPTGGLRFMPPVTPTHWQGVRSVTKPTPVCPQHIPRQYYDALRSRSNVINHERLQYLRRLIPLLRNQSEDCLHLNIYVPILSNGMFIFYFILFFVLKLILKFFCCVEYRSCYIFNRVYMLEYIYQSMNEQEKGNNKLMLRVHVCHCDV